MEIQYLKKYFHVKDTLKNYPTNKWNPEGLSLKDIENLEHILNEGSSFPRAFREFLHIGGKYDGLGINGPIDGLYDRMTKGGKLRIQGRGIQIHRPFLTYHSFEGNVFSFIYLDEGDDPQPWNISIDEAYDTDEGENLWKTPFTIFNEMIHYLVDNALKGLQPW
ncbi:hypothetical protein [Kordia zhangzhouensis]|uniref:hypothetical protein n=1 Tax=Kordia zhangzhouensis TaxID=1620405 RepID=UPI000629B20A|nr:hypothetical protein [Kordia zhangzhouensis]